MEFQNKKKDKNHRLIAYIKKEGEKNILLDLNGNKILNKNKEGDYEYPFLLNVLIKDSDVQHPETRSNDEKKYINLAFKNNIINNNNISLKKKQINKDKFLNLRRIIFDISKRNIINNKYNCEKEIGSYRNNFHKIKSISLNKFISNSEMNDILEKNNNIISRTHLILNMNKTNNNQYINKNAIPYPINYDKIQNKNDTKLYNINKKKIPLNPLNHYYFPKKQYVISPRIINNSKFYNYEYFDYSTNLNYKSNIHNKNINKFFYNNNFFEYLKECKLNNKSDIFNSFVDIKNNKRQITNYSSGINNNINNYISINNSKYNNKNIFINKKKGNKIKISNDKYINKKNYIKTKLLNNSYFINDNNI